MNASGGRTSADTKPPVARPRLRGFLVGLCLGAIVWAAYFIKTNDWAFWTVSVVPVVVFLAVLALTLGLKGDKRYHHAMAVGALTSIPLVMLAVTAFALITMGTLD